MLPPAIRFAAYQKRNALLRELGFVDYKSYLKTKLWKSIRQRVLKKAKGICHACYSRDATEVHHKRYTALNLSGKKLDGLVAVCRGCHGGSEFENGEKRSLAKTNVAMNQLTKEALGYLPGFCVVCGKNPPRRGRDICGRCKREAPYIPAV